MDEAVKLRKDATLKERLYDRLGAFTVVRNGTVCEKQADQDPTIDMLNKMEIVEAILKELEGIMEGDIEGICVRAVLADLKSLLKKEDK